ncbi:MAG: hypothetical protein MUE36_07890 [Acidimicrobiales bacterium]|nr:hypothetical protein [Acidimicrobiales bacterium]
MFVELVTHPEFPTSVLTADGGTLDRLAAEYTVALDGAPPEMERFLFGEVPLRVFHDLFSGAGEIDDATARWLLLLSGYFGGRWLRGEIAEAQPDALLVSFSQAPTLESFRASMGIAQQALDASRADTATVLAFARSSLFDTPSDDPEGAPRPGLTDSFGYNAGYNLEILEAPPVGLDTPDRFRISCTGLLHCWYATPRLPALTALESVARALADGGPGWSELAAELQPIQDAAVPRGRSVWSTGLSVQGFPQSSYDQLLEVSSSFLETVQASALTMAKGVVEADEDAARVGARAVAAMTVWLDAYTTGLVDGEGTIELPAFVP